MQSRLNLAHERVPNVCAVIENTAGQGTNLGYKLEELAAIIEQVKDQSRVGVCIDTCHFFAAGYDLRTAQACDASFKTFDEIIGFDYLRGMHLNDAKTALGKRVDRHHSLGEGEIGWDCFKYIMQDLRFDGVPMVLETVDDTIWHQEIAQLKTWAR